MVKENKDSIVKFLRHNIKEERREIKEDMKELKKINKKIGMKHE